MKFQGLQKNEFKIFVVWHIVEGLVSYSIESVLLSDLLWWRMILFL